NALVEFTNAGKTWQTTGTGGDFIIYTGTGGSYLNARCYRLRYRNYTDNAELVTLRPAPQASTKGAVQFAASGPMVVQCTGTPEAQVTAPVGSLAVRDDGGASTTLYVKESGAGNTGWVAK